MFEELLWRIVIGNEARMQLLEQEAAEQELDRDQLQELVQEHGMLSISNISLSNQLRFPNGSN
jgi:hypothetical protein